MRRNLSEQTKQYNKKLRSNKKLAKKALKNCFKIKPAHGPQVFKRCSSWFISLY